MFCLQTSADISQRAGRTELGWWARQEGPINSSLLGLPFPIYSTRGLVFIKSSTARTLGDSTKAQPACGPLLFCPCVCIIISSQAHPFPDSLTDMAQEVQGALHARVSEQTDNRGVNELCVCVSVTQLYLTLQPHGL